MKIRNLLVGVILIALGAICAQAQERDGSLTFKDHLGQSLTISRFGTVLKFTHRMGEEYRANNYFRICPSGGDSECIESDGALPSGTTAKLKVKYPKQGAVIRKRKTLVVTATIHQGELTAEREITWRAGSGAINIHETVSPARSRFPVPCAIKLRVLEESASVTPKLRILCPLPPGKCPPEDAITAKLGKIEMTKELEITCRKPLRASIDYDFLKKQ